MDKGDMNMADNNNFEEIGPKDELIDAIAQLDDEGDRVIELKDEVSMR